MSYSLSMSSLSWGYSHLTTFSWLRSSLFVICLAIIGGIFYHLIPYSEKIASATIIFALSYGLFNLVQIATGVLIQKRLKTENRMIITKYVSFYARLGMVISLLTLHWLFARNWETPDIFQFYASFTLFAFVLVLGFAFFKNKKEKKYVSSQSEN